MRSNLAYQNTTKSKIPLHYKMTHHHAGTPNKNWISDELLGPPH